MFAEIDSSQASGWALFLILPILFLFVLAVLLPLIAFAEDGTIYETSGELWGRDSGGTLYKNSGEIWGRVTEGGTIYRTDGQLWGRVTERGTIFRNDGQIWGRVSR